MKNKLRAFGRSLLLDVGLRGKLPFIFFLLLVLPLLYGVQAVYYHIFKTFLVLYSIGGAGNAIGSFWREALTGIWQSLPVIVPLFLPGVLWLIFRKRLTPRRSKISPA